MRLLNVMDFEGDTGQPTTLLVLNFQRLYSIGCRSNSVAARRSSDLALEDMIWGPGSATYQLLNCLASRISVLHRLNGLKGP